ncbi:MAG: prepilin peptidase, partial [Pseudomonadota bacterium]
MIINYQAVLSAPSAYFIAIAFAAILGSFINMLCWRLPRNLDIVVRPSFCIHCNKPLRWFNLLPVISFLWQSGKSYCCKKKLPARYFLVEVASIILVLTASEYSYNLSYFIALSITSLILLAMTVIDFEHMIIPDSLQIALAATLLWLNLSSPIEIIWLQQLITMLLLGGIFYLASTVVSRIKKQPALGFGDVKLVAVSGIALPLELLATYLLISGIFGTVIGYLWQKK